MKLRTRILLDARDPIADKQFWTTGTMNTETDPPRFCLTGAICEASSAEEDVAPSLIRHYNSLCQSTFRIIFPKFRFASIYSCASLACDKGITQSIIG